MTLDYYRIFYYVAQYQSFSKAAEILGNNQPNLSQMCIRDRPLLLSAIAIPAADRKTSQNTPVLSAPKYAVSPATGSVSSL